MLQSIIYTILYYCSNLYTLFLILYFYDPLTTENEK
jgi:hypothetical protein